MYDRLPTEQTHRLMVILLVALLALALVATGQSLDESAGVLLGPANIVVPEFPNVSPTTGASWGG